MSNHPISDSTCPPEGDPVPDLLAGLFGPWDHAREVAQRGHREDTLRGKNWHRCERARRRWRERSDELAVALAGGTAPDKEAREYVRSVLAFRNAVRKTGFEWVWDTVPTDDERFSGVVALIRNAPPEAMCRFVLGFHRPNRGWQMFEGTVGAFPARLGALLERYRQARDRERIFGHRPASAIRSESEPAAGATVAGDAEPGSAPSGEKGGEGGTSNPFPDRVTRDPNKPGSDRQNDIVAAIRSAGMPLTRPELVEAMKLKTEGKLGGNLAWMVTNKVLVNIPQRGYWPAGEPVPE